MKKIIFAAAVSMGMAVSGSVMAADNDAPFEGNVNVTPVEANGGCPMLAGTVRLGVSANVWGMWQCDEDNNVVKVGACHQGGSREPASCAMLPGPNGTLGEAEGNDDHWNYEGCTEAGVAPPNPIPDYNAYIVGSAGGTVSASPLSGRCNDTTIAALDFFQ